MFVHLYYMFKLILLFSCNLTTMLQLLFLHYNSSKGTAIFMCDDALDFPSQVKHISIPICSNIMF